MNIPNYSRRLCIDALALVASLATTSPLADYLWRPGDIARDYGWTEAAALEKAGACLTRAGISFDNITNYAGRTLVIIDGTHALSRAQQVQARCLH